MASRSMAERERVRSVLVGSAALPGVVALCMAACGGGQSGAEVIGQGVGGSQQSPGGFECQVADDCRESVLQELGLLAQSHPPSIAASSAECGQFSVLGGFEPVSGNACTCGLGEVGNRVLGPVGVGCYVRGRAGDCLWGDGEFSGCDLEDANSCTQACGELATRLNADRARTHTTNLEYVACERGYCRSIVAIDGQCYVGRSYRNNEAYAEAYACSRGAEAILAQHDQAQSAAEPTYLERPTPYLPGSTAFVQLDVADDYYGVSRVGRGFGAYAQFFDAIEGTSSQAGEVADPLEGVDDCGVTRLGSTGTAPNVRLRSVERAVLKDGSSEYPLEEFRSSSADYYSYVLDLAPSGVSPRFGESYGFSASGGGFGASIDLSVALPEELTLSTFETRSRFERGPLTLSWTGRGQAPLAVSLSITSKLADIANPYRIDCLLADDGEFTIPEAVLSAAPDGFVLAGFTRENRELVMSGGRKVTTFGRASVSHRFAFGPACDGSAIVQACVTSANTILAAYAACNVPPPAPESLCPDYLAQTCLGCPEYFECKARTTRCDAAGLSGGVSCSCP